MSKNKVTYICQTCGTQYAKWVGKCDGCGSWNTILEELTDLNISGLSQNLSKKDVLGRVIAMNELTALASELLSRYDTGFEELNRVLGGGIVAQSTILLSGEPGIGKSTLLLQLCNKLALKGIPSIYISAEESLNQLKIRAQRLKIEGDDIKILTTTSLLEIIATVNSNKKSCVLIVDSIQTIYLDEISATPGSMSQVKACAFELIKLAKQLSNVVIIVGHVTKDGQIAGPKLLEHMVDVVLSFEGENMKQHRIIRSIKNRYGATNDIGIFTMSNDGLMEVKNPSELFVTQQYDGGVAGSCIAAFHEGSRSIIVEIQALTSQSFFTNPRRLSIGWDSPRLGMIIAILNSRIGIKLMDKEVYLNVVGGLKINETGIDLAVAVALLSAYYGILITRDTVFIGEIGLLGELRPISYIDNRLNEASKLGFKKAIIPKENLVNVAKSELRTSIEVEGFSNLKQVFNKIKTEFTSEPRKVPTTRK
ncbi:DNA repair protein RadA-like protein [Candidatus Fokinia solitaria]|uniref:DNA repair protein RadA n=1 Tax=Candidatus Fokinia solitaria TaxID=1802984 RepID=A0A2U8BRU0_9RICK|nr:DNA repair protein RadA [Candidatus Fokinia solitaria]AWD33013.1 DNA repair protein RadA-like protein [Candidatus Fokinia solitaria]